MAARLGVTAITTGLLAISLSISVPTSAWAQGRNNGWQQQQNYQRQQEQMRQQQIQQQQAQQRQQMQEQMRRQQQEQMRQQMQAQQRQQMQQQMQTQQRQQMQQQQRQQTADQQRKQLQQQGRLNRDGKPTGIVVSGGVAKLTRPLTPAEIQRGFTGKVTADGKALVKYQNRVFAVPASRVAGLSARLAKQKADRRAAQWSAQQTAAVAGRVSAIASSGNDGKTRVGSQPSGTRSQLLSSASPTAVSARLEAAQIARLQARGFRDDSIGAMRNPNPPGPPSNEGRWRLRSPHGTIGQGENVLISANSGLQSRATNKFDTVVQGTHGQAESKYLWTIDGRGVNIALEKTPADTGRGHIVHTNISDRAYSGGEAWFQSDGSVTINAGSGRFGDRSGLTEGQYQESIKRWEALGYKVNAIPLHSR